MSPGGPNFLELFADIQKFIYLWKEATAADHVKAIKAYNTIIETIYGLDPRPRVACRVGPVKFLPDPPEIKT